MKQRAKNINRELWNKCKSPCVPYSFVLCSAYIDEIIKLPVEIFF
jgi:hypothetical protein